MKTVTMEVSTKINGEMVTGTFETDMPENLKDAIAMLGEVDSYHAICASLAIKKQAPMRASLKGETKSKRKASWAKELGI